MITNVDEILSTAPVESVIGQYVNLQRHGQNLVGNCPFHDEKTGSFTVSPSKQIYKCFGCGEGGNNSAQFLMKHKDKTFPEALEMIAAKNGVRVEYADDSNREEIIKLSKERQEKKEVQKDAMAFGYDLMLTDYHSRLKDEKEITYAGKTYSIETIKKWKIVEVQDNKIILTVDSEKKEIFKQIGLIATNKMDKLYPYFYNRLLFPIHHTKGHIEGITGRISDDKKPKYLNSPESELYDKSNSLFGIYFNAKNIRERHFCYLVEGPTDVVILDQFGISNVVATCGTSITENQIKLIAGYTDTINILTDGDSAGEKSMVGVIDTIIKCQMQCNVVELPAKEDPASLCIKLGGDEFRAYVDKNTTEGIKYKVSKMIGKKPNEFQKSQAITYAANIISLIDSGILREQYVKTISTVIGTTMKILNDSVEEYFDQRLKKKNRLSSDQENDKANYGIYEMKNAYFHYLGYDVSNFILKPIFLVRYGQHSYRFFDMINVKNQSIAINLPSDDMIGLNSFKKNTEKFGYFLFKGKEEDFMKVKSKVFDNMPTVHQLPYLGYIASQGIYAWGNGITTPDGEFIPVDEYGRVEYNGVSYFMPAYSKINTQEIIGTEDESDYEKLFIYKTTDIPFKGFVKEIQDVFGRNGLIILGYYFASLHKDFIQKKYNNFPLINLFGPPGSGKSTLAYIIHGMFGIPINPIHCTSSTYSAFFRRVAQTKNAIVWYEEYSAKVEKLRGEGLKGFFDGFARPLAKIERGNKIETMPVLSSVMLSGQVLPTHDPALLERCITLFFDVIKDKDPNQKKRLDRLHDRAAKGEFSFFTGMIHGKRKQLLSEYDLLFEEIKSRISKRVPSDTNTRVLMSYSIIATFLLVTMDLFEIEVDVDAIFDEFSVRILEQNKINEGATELIEFWQMIEYLVSKQELSKAFFAVEHTEKINIKDQENPVIFSKPAKLLYLKLNNAHKEYLRAAKSQGLERVLEINSIKYYLSVQKYFVGECPAKRINNGSPQRYWVFNLDEMPFIDLGSEPVGVHHEEFGNIKKEKPIDNPSEGMSFQQPTPD